MQSAACVTVNARPAMVRLPVRAPPVLAPTVNATEPFPVPLDPDVTVIHDALLGRSPGATGLCGNGDRAGTAACSDALTGR